MHRGTERNLDCPTAALKLWVRQRVRRETAEKQTPEISRCETSMYAGLIVRWSNDTGVQGVVSLEKELEARAHMPIIIAPPKGTWLGSGQVA